MKPADPITKTEKLDLSDVVAEMQDELRCLLGRGIQLTIGRLPESGSATVLGRHEEVVDLLRHLALDIRDAMPTGGNLSIRTGRLRDVNECAALVLHEVPASPPPNAKPRPATLRKGRGLGLSASYDSVERAGGHFHVSCRAGETVITICYPLVP